MLVGATRQRTDIPAYSREFRITGTLPTEGQGDIDFSNRVHAPYRCAANKNTTIKQGEGAGKLSKGEFFMKLVFFSNSKSNLPSYDRAVFLRVEGVNSAAFSDEVLPPPSS